VPPVSAPYRPGQQWPHNGPQRPERPPPIQFRQEDASPPPPNKTLQWVLRAAGLVAVAVVSGLVWYYITNDTTSTPAAGGEESSTQQPEGVYQFTPHEDMPKPNRVKNCADHAYGDIKTFLSNTPCDHLTRQLFVAKLDDGRTVYTSVSVVKMHDEAEATSLRELTDQNDTGNVSDVVKDGLVKISGLKALSGNDGYKSKQNGREVVIVESDFAPKDRSGDDAADQKVLDDVCEDALRKADEVDGGSGSG